MILEPLIQLIFPGRVIDHVESTFQLPVTRFVAVKPSLNLTWVE